MFAGLWMQQLSPHTRALARLASASPGKARLARQGVVWEGMLATYQLCDIIHPIYPQKGATCPREIFLCAYMLVMAEFC